MGLFSHHVFSRPYGCDPVRAPDLPGEDVGILMEMEWQIREAARIEAVTQEAARRIVSGDRGWYEAISIGSVHEVQRDRIERAAIAEAFKKLKQKP